MNMNFEIYSKVIEHISDVTTNQYLDLGWKLLYVGQLNDGECANTAFVVGWPRELGTPREPAVM